MDGKEIANVLIQCEQKLTLYYKAVGGEYVGGVPLQDLNKNITKAIAALTEEAK